MIVDEAEGRFSGILTKIHFKNWFSIISWRILGLKKIARIEFPFKIKVVCACASAFSMVSTSFRLLRDVITHLHPNFPPKL